MQETTTIRPIAEADYEVWCQLWRQYLAFYETSLGDEIYRTSFSRMMSGNPGEFQGLLAEVQGKPVGLAHYLFHRSMWSVENTCYLMDLFVDPHTRGTGIGRALIDAVHSKAAENGVTTTYWMTQEFNYKGRMLYDQVAEKTPFLVYEKH
ncbi:MULTISPECIES: GNAT family N-acetyltransferase [unclassified Ruegeria]|uniref:GNAT family N-acetyltransferase n=1 Tax=unclassified Ruegeria TaxID=2625375 RepID=UPI00148887B4|nr:MULTISPECIES: GNAT family N-acetyltransferase [unclassified Ruegeria]